MHPKALVMQESTRKRAQDHPIGREHQHRQSGPGRNPVSAAPAQPAPGPVLALAPSVPVWRDGEQLAGAAVLRAPVARA